MSIPDKATKRCNKCAVLQPIDQFRTDRSKSGDRANRCKSCDRAYYAANRDRIRDQRCSYEQVNADLIRQRRRAARATNNEVVNAQKRARYAARRDLEQQRDRARYVVNRETVLAQNREYRKANAERIAERFRRYRYGITADQHVALLAHQGGRCAGCGTDRCPTGRALSIDHDHTCCPPGARGQTRRACGMCIRGLVCSPCNLADALAGHPRIDLDALVSEPGAVIRIRTLTVQEGQTA